MKPLDDRMKAMLWLFAEIADDVPLENVEAICQALERHSLAFSG